MSQGEVKVDGAMQPHKPFDDLALSKQNVEAAQADQSDKVYRVYCDGIFDLFHLGHMKMLEQAKNALGSAAKVHLIVGVCSDEITQQYKGKTVLSHKVRCDSCSQCKHVDEVAPDAPWVINDEFLAKYRVDFVAHDALPYADTSGASADGDVYSGVKRKGMFLETKRTDGISTSDIIAVIVRDYDLLIERNLSRGFTKEQLNVGATWEVRKIAREKRDKIQKALIDTRRDGKGLTESAEAFVKLFNPKGARGAQYMKKLRKEIPERAGGVAHHAWGLTTSVAHLGVYCLSFVNPFAYCQKRKPKPKTN